MQRAKLRGITLKWWIKVFISSLLLYLILRKVGLTSLISASLSVNIFMFIPSALLGLLFTFIKTYKWYYLLKNTARDISFRAALKSYLIGVSFGLVTPARAGEISRAFFLESTERIRFAALVVLDKIFDLTVVVALGLGSSFFFLGGKVTALLTFFLALALLLLLGYRPILSFWKRNLFSPQKGVWNNLLSHIPNILSFRLIAVSLCLTVVSYLVVLLEAYLLISGFERVLPLVVLWVFPLVMLSNILPVTIGGLGVREGLAAFLFSRFSVAASSAVGASFLIFIFNTLAPAVAGAILFASFGLERGYSLKNWPRHGKDREDGLGETNRQT